MERSTDSRAPISTDTSGGNRGENSGDGRKSSAKEAASQPAAAPARAGGRSIANVAATLVADDMARVDELLSAQMESPIGRIPSVGAHLLGAGGKRLRPLLTVLAARATGVDPETAATIGVAAELVHTATLYHDDVVDDGRVRRGRPAARMVFGNGIVVLVGDYCYARALRIAADTGHVKVVQTMADTVTEMAEGEVAQLENAGRAEVAEREYFTVIDRKTASLIAWCARVGGLVPSDLEAPLARYGRGIGRAFQIADDILDCAVEEEVAGKSVGHDLQEGKLTLPVLMACEADPLVLDRVRREMTDHGVSAAVAAEILTAVQRAGGVERAREKARAIAAAAREELLALAPGPYRDALEDIVTLSVERVT